MALGRLEAEYNNRLKVPGHGAIMDGWRARSAALRDGHPFRELDVAYGASPRQAMDVFWPDAGRSATLAMFIHGGYWQGLDRRWFSHVARGFLDSGLAVAVPSYDLCPQVTVGAIVAQMQEAVGFLAARYGRGLYAVGHSAGGHLAAMLLAEGRVHGACAISGLFDLAPLVETSINGALGLDAAEARRLSPVFLPRPAGALMAWVGALEGQEYTRQSEEIARAWGGRFAVIPDADHFTAIAPLEDAGSAMMRAIVDATGRCD